MEQIKNKKTYTGTIYKVMDGSVVVYVGFTTGDITKVSVKLQKTTNANLHNYIITQLITPELKLVVLDMIEDITITELNKIKMRLKGEYGVVDVVRANGIGGEDTGVVDVDVDVNNPENNMVMEGDFVEKLKPVNEYKKLPVKCACGSVYNKATKYRHEKTKKHLDWFALNNDGNVRFCECCGKLGCELEKARQETGEKPAKVFYDHKTGKKI